MRRKVFDDTIYYFDKIPTVVQPFTVVLDRDRGALDRRGGQHLARPASGPASPGPVAPLRMIGDRRRDARNAIQIHSSSISREGEDDDRPSHGTSV